MSDDAETFVPPWGDPDAKTPEQITTPWLLSHSKAEVLDAYPDLGPIYDRVMRAAEAHQAVIENRRGQAGVDIPSVISLGSRFGSHRREDGLHVVRRNPFVIDVTLDDK